MMKCNICNQDVAHIANNILKCCEPCVRNLPQIIETSYNTAKEYGEKYIAEYALLNEDDAQRVDKVWKLYQQVMELMFPRQRDDATRKLIWKIEKTIAANTTISKTLDYWWQHIQAQLLYEDVLFKSISVKDKDFAIWVRRWNAERKG